MPRENWKDKGKLVDFTAKFHLNLKPFNLKHFNVLTLGEDLFLKVHK